jgi:hypothetical protein
MMRIDPNIPDADGFYEALIAANEGLTEGESEAFLMRLVLLLANQVGDQQVLLAALRTAREMVADKQRG